MNWLVLIVGVTSLGLISLVAFVLFVPLRRRARLEARLRAVAHPETIDTGSRQAGQAPSFASWIATIGSAITQSGLLSENTVAGLNQTLGKSGLRGPGMLGLFVGTKLLLLVLLPAITLALLHPLEISDLTRNVSLAVAALVGLLGPDWWVRHRYKQYLNAIVLGLPDALDLMVICAEAGLGFEPAINRVAAEIRQAHPAITEEFLLTASELRVVADGRVALTNMGARTGLDSIKRMASMLIQTMRYGTPLSDALRVLSAEMRHETLIRYETRAARLPVLLTIPMVLFILPCIFLIVGGPAVIQVTNSFR